MIIFDRVIIDQIPLHFYQIRESNCLIHFWLYIRCSESLNRQKWIESYPPVHDFVKVWSQIKDDDFINNEILTVESSLQLSTEKLSPHAEPIKIEFNKILESFPIFGIWTDFSWWKWNCKLCFQQRIIHQWILLLVISRGRRFPSNFLFDLEFLLLKFSSVS